MSDHFGGEKYYFVILAEIKTTSSSNTSITQDTSIPTMKTETVCVRVCVRERVCVCVRERERERDRECVCMCEYEKGRGKRERKAILHLVPTPKDLV